MLQSPHFEDRLGQGLAGLCTPQEIGEKSQGIEQSGDSEDSPLQPVGVSICG